MENIKVNVRDNLIKVVENKGVIKALRVENEGLLKDVLSQVKEDYKGIIKAFKLKNKQKALKIVKLNYDLDKSLNNRVIGSVVNYYNQNLTININMVSTSLFCDLVSLVGKGYITSSALKKAKTREDYIRIKKEGLKAKELKTEEKLKEKV